MLFSLLYLILRRVLGRGDRPQDERDIELLVLRHQLRVLRRQVKRPRLRRADRTSTPKLRLAQLHSSFTPPC